MARGNCPPPRHTRGYNWRPDTLRHPHRAPDRRSSAARRSETAPASGCRSCLRRSCRKSPGHARTAPPVRSASAAPSARWRPCRARQRAAPIRQGLRRTYPHRVPRRTKISNTGQFDERALWPVLRRPCGRTCRDVAHGQNSPATASRCRPRSVAVWYDPAATECPRVRATL